MLPHTLVVLMLLVEAPKSGEITWYAAPARPACFGESGHSAPQMAALTLVPGAGFSGSTDARLRAYDNAHRALIWQFDTLRDFETVNGLKAFG